MLLEKKRRVSPAFACDCGTHLVLSAYLLPAATKVERLVYLFTSAPMPAFECHFAILVRARVKCIHVLVAGALIQQPFACSPPWWRGAVVYFHPRSST